MLRGLYIAGSGMTERAANLEVVANNIANMQTDAFKRDRVAYSTFKEMYLNRIQEGQKEEPVGKLALGSIMGTDTFTDFTQGALVSTGDDHDLAIEGEGFVKVSLPDESMRYTRDVHWNLTQDGLLVDDRGFAIMDEKGGEIALTGKGNVSISDNGDVYQDGKIAAKIGLIEFDDNGCLEKDSSSMYRLNGDPFLLEKDAENTSLRQGYVEKANFSPLNAVTEMIEILREYESSQKVVQIYDETINQAINKLGKAQ